jgi:hypothetical protein
MMVKIVGDPGRCPETRAQHACRSALPFAILSAWAVAVFGCGTALAQQTAGDGGADAGVPSDAAPSPEAAHSSGCMIDLNGGLSASRVPCVRLDSRIQVDSGPIGTNIVIEATTNGGSPVTIRLLVKGQPRLGRDAIPSTSFVYANAKTRNERGIEWEAISNVQGVFNLNVTGVITKKSKAGTYYEIHGALDAVLPFTNLQTWSPVSEVFLHVDL